MITSINFDRDAGRSKWTRYIQTHGLLSLLMLWSNQAENPLTMSLRGLLCSFNQWIPTKILKKPFQSKKSQDYFLSAIMRLHHGGTSCMYLVVLYLEGNFSLFFLTFYLLNLKINKFPTFTPNFKFQLFQILQKMTILNWPEIMQKTANRVFYLRTTIISAFWC